MLVAIFKQYWVLFVVNNFRGSGFASVGLLLIRAQLSGQAKKAGTRPYLLDICCILQKFFTEMFTHFHPMHYNEALSRMKNEKNVCQDFLASQIGWGCI